MAACFTTTASQSRKGSKASVKSSSSSSSRRIFSKRTSSPEISTKSISSDDHVDQIIDQECFADAANLPILDIHGNPHTFDSLYTTKGTRHLIIFIRNFLCGLCQDYITALSASITPAALASLTPPVSISIIGCGSPDLIQAYMKRTGCPFPIYVDPSRRLHDVMHFGSNLQLGPSRPEYQTTSLPGMIVRSVVQGITAGTGAFKGGDFSQVGGEFIVLDGVVQWGHRMASTRDHTEVRELQRLLGAKI